MDEPQKCPGPLFCNCPQWPSAAGGDWRRPSKRFPIILSSAAPSAPRPGKSHTEWSSKPGLPDSLWWSLGLRKSSVIQRHHETEEFTSSTVINVIVTHFRKFLCLQSNWTEANIYKEIFVFVTLSGLVVTVQQNSQESTMKLRHYVHNALCCRSEKGSYITCEFFTTCSWELSEEGDWGLSFLIFISFVSWKQTQRQGKTQKLFTCDHRVGVTIVSILKLPYVLLYRWPLT